MILCLDIGNSQIYGGVFSGEKKCLQFRHTTTHKASSDQLGIFLRAVLRENGIMPESITQIAICSVVPDIVYSLRNCCLKYFNIDPFFLKAGVKTGLKIKYRNPHEVGADRIANAVAASQLYPQKDVIIVDFGTATTFCALSKKKEYLGGVIIAGLRLSMEALYNNTSKLPAVEIKHPESVLGRATVESIQSGLFYGHLGQIHFIAEKIREESFAQSQPLLIGTGGFAILFEKSNLFDDIVPDLVLKGLYLALQKNKEHATEEPSPHAPQMFV